MEHYVDFGKHKIDFDLKFKNRKTLGIKVLPDTSVEVIAPIDLSMQDIRINILKKAMWILKQKSYFLNMNAIRNETIVKSGYSVNYLGRRYKLIIEVSDKDDVIYKGNLFIIYTKKKNNSKTIFEKWLKERAYNKITEIASPIIKKFNTSFNVPTDLFFQEMPTRWGSCTINNKLIFNPKLIHVPKRCIEYVIMHELCHTVHKHHNKDFFQLLALMMPDWEKRKERLDNYA